MIAQWDSSLSVPPVARVQFPTMAEYFKGFLPADHSSGRTKRAEWLFSKGASLEKSLQSHEDHEMPMDQPDLRQNRKKFSHNTCYCSKWSHRITLPPLKMRSFIQLNSFFKLENFFTRVFAQLSKQRNFLIIF